MMSRLLHKGPSIKDVRAQRGGGGQPKSDQLGQGEGWSLAKVDVLSSYCDTLLVNFECQQFQGLEKPQKCSIRGRPKLLNTDQLL